MTMKLTAPTMSPEPAALTITTCPLLPETRDALLEAVGDHVAFTSEAEAEEVFAVLDKVFPAISWSDDPGPTSPASPLFDAINAAASSGKVDRERTKPLYDLILNPARPIDPATVSVEDLRIELDNAARRLHEVADALDNASDAVKAAIDMEVALADEVSEALVVRLAPSAIVVMTARDAAPALRSAAEATEARARSLRSVAPTRGTCALRGSKRA
ncbi:hypothetical protein [Nitratidesulfovibrio liaohensis]|uniref:Uncharacterized protein n=1 Tax=Nitratidesulfovibrio liaohensis TaxID=2604158 RepID=A0ABY9R427_9BACT|nr:hypothetical protein [Nitratidesulfovibrio liaohensis]EGY23896.1 hypothetical protein DA2_3901 [Desulfovibrio sp. A2]WMW65962.1 hypothetical protein KPS_000498 [Nitratidesulfovibrio liaohensis]